MVLLPSLRPQNAKKTGTPWEAGILKAAWSGRDVKSLGQKKTGVGKLVKIALQTNSLIPSRNLEISAR
jgi:hypothetical protein